MSGVWTTAAHVSGRVITWRTSCMELEGFALEEERVIVESMPSAVLDRLRVAPFGAEFRIHAGLFLGRPRWSNIRCAFGNAGLPLPEALEAMARARADQELA